MKLVLRTWLATCVQPQGLDARELAGSWSELIPQIAFSRLLWIPNRPKRRGAQRRVAVELMNGLTPALA